MDNIVIFGASGGAVKVTKTLKNLKIDFRYFVDNDKNKWGKVVEGKVVNPPEILFQEKCNILVASDYQMEIEKQLSEMGLIENIIIKEELIMDYVNKHIEEFNYLKEIAVDKADEKKLVFGLEEGLVLGGIESFTFMLANEMKPYFKNINIFTKKTDNTEPAGLEDNICYFNLDYDDYWNGIKRLVEAIIKNSPCVIIDNWQNQVLIAVAIIKKYFPGLVKCISVIHNDKVVLYRKAAFMQEHMDVITGVSQKINNNLINGFGVDKTKVHYKESPVEYNKNFKRNYTVDKNMPLKIGYAARVTKFQKRADLIVPLMLELNRHNVNYHLNIAGDGNYFNKLKELIKENGLSGYITLYGNIPREKMPDYWKDQDIFLSVSDFEGASISMLEAMSFGAVPVVTAVSGTDEFIKDGDNGFVSGINDIEEISNKIEYIEKNRMKLTGFGNKARETVKVKADKNDYINYVLKLIND
mgnify:FL=1